MLEPAVIISSTHGVSQPFHVHSISKNLLEGLSLNFNLINCQVCSQFLCDINHTQLKINAGHGCRTVMFFDTTSAASCCFYEQITKQNQNELMDVEHSLAKLRKRELTLSELRKFVE